ncbi:GAF domain-containing protein [Rhizobium ruizarguesonis]|uniref:AAA family ATPase n=1 Tax=Rhizobium ruizarguesonis TaxID=2081791 RepID=UPI001030EF3A|nr:AAA family ATPase [Rhizobium ruizarguesonis]TBA75538.1 GAF domain-containing protein [Rhizobium ruizarguesonis]
MDVSRYQRQLLLEDDGFVLYRGLSEDGSASVLMKAWVSVDTQHEKMRRLEREMSLADRLDSGWAAKPIALERHDGQTYLLLTDGGGMPLSTSEEAAFDTGTFLSIAVNAVAALRKVHARGIVHKDLRPANVLVDVSGKVWLTGFGAPPPSTGPAVDASGGPQGGQMNSLPYVAPEQTGRVKRSVDARSDLYALGVVFYEMLTGELPFVAVDAVEWVHAHVARRPIPLQQRSETVPSVLERVVLKLLAKRPEDRYQTATGLEHDLRTCLDSWNSTGRVVDFEVASSDAADRLRVPEGLYGRSRQTSAIRAAFDRVRSQGVTEVVLVSGPAGVGKSSVVHELRKSLGQSGSLFASGKFDQYTRDIPYATIAQAFRGVVRQILGSGDAELERWKKELVEVLGPNGRLMINLVPELALIIGERPPAPELQPHEAKARFHLVFGRFLAVFARPERPLVLFIDDVQWLDAATIELIETITVDKEIRNLLLICAYRDDEVPSEHPLNATRDSMRQNLEKLEELKLSPLTAQDVGNLLSDMLRSDVRSVGSLATLVVDKTEGNPFFVLQFLASMEDEELVVFDVDRRVWRWDADRIRNTRVTDNVAELVASKLNRLPRLTLEIVKLLACLGSGASLATLSIASGKTKRQIGAILWEAVQARLLLRVDDAFVFAHDRVQEAAYLLVPAADLPDAHVRIGRALISSLTPSGIHERIFELVDQFARGLGQVTSDGEREQVAELFLEAGTRAKTSVAYPSSLRYFRTGLSLLKPSHWDTRYDLIFALELQQAECEYLTGDHSVADDHLLTLSLRSRDRVDGAAVVRLRSSLFVTLGDQAKAVDVALAYLRDFGIDWSPHPTEHELRLEIEALRGLLADRPIEDLVNLPRMTDPDWLAAMDVLAYTILPAILTDGNLEDVIYTQMVSLSLQHGNCDASCYAYVSIMVALGLRFGDYQSGGRFGDVGLALVDQHGMDRFKTRTYTCYACFVVPWTRHLRISETFSRKAIQAGVAAGDLVFIVTTAQMLVSHLLVAGADLARVEEEAEKFLASAQRTGFSLAADSAIGQLLLVRELRGLDGPDTAGGSVLPDKALYQQHLQDAGGQLVLPLAWYWIQQMQARYVAGDFVSAINAEREARGVVQATRSFIDIGEYHFYAALIHAAVVETAAGDDRAAHFAEILRHQKQIETWAESGTENHGNRRALVAAEVARLENRDMDALGLYEEAVRSAKQYGFIQNEAMANELASRFCAERGLKTSATAFLRNARSCYLAWGANGKVRQLDRESPGLNPEINGQRKLGSEVQHLDMAAVVAMSQAVSGEIFLDRLVERLMITVVEHSGAVRGLLLLPKRAEMHIVAEALTNDEGVSVKFEGFERKLPETILSYVTRTQEVVILDEASSAEFFSSDPYVEEAGSSSILCLPLVKQKQLVGALYLENGLSSHLFTEDQVAVLQLLASQAAISLENAVLFREAQETHERARRAAEELRLSYDMIPALAWNSLPDGTVVSCNKQWHDFTGIPQGLILDSAWSRSIHPDDIEKVVAKWKALIAAEKAGEIEARMIRFDGVARSFLIRATPMRDADGKLIKWYGTNTDIDDLKRIEEAQELLARAGRLTALGELTASIAHEVNQPLMAIVMNAATCLRWLSDEQLDVEEARQAAERIIRDGHRAGDVITSIRALARKSPLAMEEVDVNSMIEGVLVLTRGELQRHGIKLETDLGMDAGSTVGDRTQLQQVVLNLILNAVEAIGSSKSRQRRLQVRSGKASDGYPLVEVADSGPGVDPSTMEQIFDAFFTTKSGGLGIGLSICRSIVETHGGRLWVTPNEPEGSVFSFTLRAARDAF